MGAENIAALHTYIHPNLGRSHRLRVVLDRMALQALDRPSEGYPAGFYFAGTEPLARSLGLSGSGHSNQDIVRRQLTLAMALGLIQKHSYRSRGRTYRGWLLLVDNWPHIDWETVRNGRTAPLVTDGPSVRNGRTIRA